MKKSLFLAFLGAATMGDVALVAAPVQKAAVRDWARTVAATPEGGFRMGNPNARVKVIEYGSLTCGHCANFAKAGMPEILGLVKTGKVSFEYRNYVLNGIDVTATLLARCGGAPGFFRLTESFYATQDQWVGKISGLSQAEKGRLKGLPEGARLGKLADIGGLTQLAAKAGVDPAKGKKCLADKEGLDRLGQIAEAANALGVYGTPTFFINGANIGTQSWETLEPILREAAG